MRQLRLLLLAQNCLRNLRFMSTKVFLRTMSIYEVYDKCPVTCPPQTCFSIIAKFKCAPEPSICKPSCRCKPGYYRNEINECISADDCQKCHGKNQYLDHCINSYCDSQSCENVGKTRTKCFLPRIPCRKGCRCQKGYYKKNNTGDCITPQQCLDVMFLLSQLALYATGKAYHQLAKFLNIKDRKEIAVAIPNYLDDITQQQNVTFNLAEKVYGSINYPLSKSFKRDTKHIFKSKAQNLDFSEPDVAAETINTWVASKTNNLINDLISPNSLDEDTRLVLTNAIYFKGNWLIPFDPKRTTKKRFYVSEHQHTHVKMMNHVGYFQYAYIDSINSKNGVTDIFNTNSTGLSGILQYPEYLYVSTAIQKAKIIVNELGSEATAANEYDIHK
ncbi:unnamed protein product [Leptidea sinapis]|uniref:Serpin domain-containing protein n=1 Tax=Leptidea sinapis TaxID=189913 RepID=A0A5E4QH94_9NEOP|nr:unnamed protein product [Leptidea sinapis]